MSDISMPRIPFSKAATIQPSPECAALIERLVPESYEGPERRCETRKPYVCAIPAVILDGNFRPQGDHFTILTRNISTKGISLLHTAPIASQYMAIELPGNTTEKLQVVMEILRVTPIELAFEIAGKFVAKLS